MAERATNAATIGVIGLGAMGLGTATALLEAGLSLAPTPRTRLGLAYQGRFASDTRQQGANLTLNLEF